MAGTKPSLMVPNGHPQLDLTTALHNAQHGLDTMHNLIWMQLTQFDAYYASLTVTRRVTAGTKPELVVLLDIPSML